MNIYFFSRHDPLPEMVTELGEITKQYRGTISSIQRDGDTIIFLELPLDGGDTISHSIPVNSIVVVVAPLPLQQEWLKAGISVLLVPQNKKEIVNREAVFNYSGLLRILDIKVISEQWAGNPVSLQEKHSERSQ